MTIIKKSILGAVIVFGFIIGSALYVNEAARDSGFNIETPQNETRSLSLTENWLAPSNQDYYSDPGCATIEDTGTLIAEKNDVCEWSSINYDTTGELGAPRYFRISGEDEPGNLDITVATYFNGSLEESETYVMNDTGTEEFNVSGDFQTENVSQVEVNATLTDPNSQAEVQLKSYDLRILESSEIETVGIAGGDLRYITLILFILIGILMISNSFPSNN